MGFCLLNNVAITAAALADAGERVLIVDWDVHHGNGTQDVFWDDPDVLYVSTHQWPAYPGTGRADEVGGPGAPGRARSTSPSPPGPPATCSVAPSRPSSTPAVEAFAPTWVLVSAGFDAHRADPLADLALSAGDFADLAGIVAGYAPARAASSSSSRAATTSTPCGRRWPPPSGAWSGAPASTETPTSGGPGTEHVDLRGLRRPHLATPDPRLDGRGRWRPSEAQADGPPGGYARRSAPAAPTTPWRTTSMAETAGSSRAERIVVGYDGSRRPLSGPSRGRPPRPTRTGARLDLVTAWEYPMSWGSAIPLPNDYDPAADAQRHARPGRRTLHRTTRR